MFIFFANKATVLCSIFCCPPSPHVLVLLLCGRPYHGIPQVEGTHAVRTTSKATSQQNGRTSNEILICCVTFQSYKNYVNHHKSVFIIQKLKLINQLIVFSQEEVNIQKG